MTPKLPRDFEECVRDGTTAECVRADTTPSAQDYLEFAKTDLEDPDSPRSRVNALGNAKRALHLQLETILRAYLGSKQSGGSFPKVVERAARIGIISPRILLRINRLRNIAEHEYYVPTRPEVEDAVDVIALYLDASDWLVDSFPSEVSLRAAYPDLQHDIARTHVCLRIRPGTGRLRVSVSECLASAAQMTTEAVQVRRHLDAEAERMLREENTRITYMAGIEVYALESVRKRMASNYEFTVDAESDGEHYETWITYLLNVSR